MRLLCKHVFDIQDIELARLPFKMQLSGREHRNHISVKQQPADHSEICRFHNRLWCAQPLAYEQSVEQQSCR
ncbi:hypothetical protein WM40_21035 [Robbsia andropogonis]|uniref:Uncharacterized protein n=1 Tax=Robbsia andropogonis TaxID=28092 RepID=A0A0F5JX07_9BURK|nr:hypothetical protein [Robbsia andropogonis]KKB61802.1 hypothetical protein WM40_21035 [Robbsia andropogonis]